MGREDEEYTVGVVLTREGEVIDSIVMKRKIIGLSLGEEREIGKNRYVLSTGYSQGFFVDQPDMKVYCEQVAKKIGARGPLNIQLRIVGKKIYIFEIHPRFSGSASLRSEMGFNEPHVLIQEFLGLKEFKKIPYKTGFAVIRKFANVVVPMHEYRKMERK